jgi:hypothetical protein
LGTVVIVTEVLRTTRRVRRSTYLRIDKLQIEFLRPAEADPASAGVVQELLGGKFGEMSTLVYPQKHKGP